MAISETLQTFIEDSQLATNYPATVRALQNLSPEDQGNFFQIFQCFDETIPLSLGSSVYNKLFCYLNFASPQLAIYALLQLKQTDLLTAENFDVIRIAQDRDPTNTAKSLIQLEKHNILTEENREYIRIHPNRRELYDALKRLNRTNLLTAENFDAIRTAQNPFKLAKMLEYLNSSHLLTPQNRELIKTRSLTLNRWWLIEIETVFTQLKRAVRLTQTRFDALLAYNGRESFANLITALNMLETDNLLVPENADALIAHTNPIKIANLLQGLNRNNILTEETRECVIAHAHQMSFHAALENLHDANLLTPVNLAHLSADNNHFLCTDAAYEMVWNRLPNHLLTQATFNQLVINAQQPNPEEHIRRYMNLLGINHLNDNALVINGAQSTHTASVHHSVSKSAAQLMDSYRQRLEDTGLEKTIAQVTTYVEKLPNKSKKNQAAKRCIQRITNANHTFTDRTSQVTTKQLLALVWLAMQDAKNRKGSLDDAKERFVEGLYEIQRGYNLSETGSDDHAYRDKPICLAGTFNKLIEKLQGIHPDCEICFITEALASLKLPPVVREEMMRYLLTLADTQTVTDFLTFTTVIEQIKKEGVDVIWDKIKGKVADRLFNEFGSLYHNDKTDSDFISFVDAGRYMELTTLGDLSCFQEKLSQSPGYHQYCSMTLRSSAKFFPMKKSADDAGEHQQDNSKIFIAG